MSWSVRHETEATHPWGIRTPAGQRLWSARDNATANQVAVAMASVDALLARALKPASPPPVVVTAEAVTIRRPYGFYNIPGAR